MSRYSIGYRMKFDNIESEDIKNILTDYLKIFKRYEIKITDKLLQSTDKIELLLNVSEDIASGMYSLHLLKNILADNREFEETKILIQLLQKHTTQSKVYLITHIPFDNISKYIKKLLDISWRLPSNYVLLLENVEVCNKNYEYLERINSLFYILDKRKIQNIGMCFDMGHLLFGIYQERISQIEGFSYIEKMSYIISNIKEIHIHDYYQKDHLQLGQGLMNLGMLSNFIRCLDVPIIIETTVNEPRKDGIRQVEKLEEFIKKT